MPREPAPKPDNREQYRRFPEPAREVGAERPGEASDRVLDQVAQSEEWLRERVKEFRDRAEQATDENIRLRLLQAAAIYEDQADRLEKAPR